MSTACMHSCCLQELYASYPDNQPQPHKTKQRLHEGRWITTPFFAHRHYRGQYK